MFLKVNPQNIATMHNITRIGPPPNTATMYHKPLLLAIDWFGIPITAAPLLFEAGGILQKVSLFFAVVYNAIRIGEWIYLKFKSSSIMQNVTFNPRRNYRRPAPKTWKKISDALKYFFVGASGILAPSEFLPPVAKGITILVLSLLVLMLGSIDMALGVKEKAVK